MLLTGENVRSWYATALRFSEVFCLISARRSSVASGSAANACATRSSRELKFRGRLPSGNASPVFGSTRLGCSNRPNTART
jgi:hypothetical protein